ncbi:MAG: hypothetical protein V1792_20220 [Pseudomonadota bacterium]
MVKRTGVILGVLAMMLALGAGMSWGYTVSQWPVAGISNTAFEMTGACLPGPESYTLRGPVAPACEPPLIPGVIHAALSVPFLAVGAVATPLMTGQLPPLGGGGCCDVELGEPAYVMAAVPCTAVNRYIPPCGY